MIRIGRLALFLLQEKLQSQKGVYIFHPALASQCCKHFVFYSRRWVVLWFWVYFTLFHLFCCVKCVLESPSEKTWLLLSLQAQICWVEALSLCLSSGSVGEAAKKMSCPVSEDPFYMCLDHLMGSCFVSPIQTTVSLQLWAVFHKFHSKRFKEYCFA